MLRRVSELVAIVVIRDLVLHCVDFDRPFWYRPDDESAGIVPGRDSFVTDALIAFALDRIDEEAVASSRGLVPDLRSEAARQVFDQGSAPDWLVEARATVRRATGPGMLYVAIGAPEGLIVQDLARLAMATFTAVLQERDAEALRP